MHLGTLEMSLRDFDEELCSGLSRVYEDWWMIRLPDWTKMRIWLWKWGIWLNYIGLGIFCGRRETSSDANIAQVDCVPAWLGEFRVNPWSVGSLDNCFGFNWGMDVENGSEGGGKLICKVGCIGSWLCVERGSKNVIFEVVNINGIVGAVLDGCSFGCRADVREEFECERFVIRLVGFVLRKVCDNSRAGSSNEKIKGMAIIMSWKVDVLSEMEIIKDARKIVRGS